MLTRRGLLGLAMAMGVALPAATAAAETQVAQASMPKIVLAMSGWTGFAPLSLAEKTGLFKNHGVDVEIKFVAQKERHLAMAAGSVQAIATTVDTHVAYTAAGVKLTQVLLLDKSNGADGIAARPAIKTFQDLKGKTVAVDGPGTTPYFTLTYMLLKNGMTPKDVNAVTFGPQPAATSFVAGQHDAAVTYEPYISQIREMKEGGKILATTVEYPCVVDTVAFQPDYIAKNPAIVRAVADGYFDALDMIAKDKMKAYEIMGAVVKQNAEQFGNSAKYIQWQDRAANVAYFDKGMAEFLKEAAQIQLDAGVIKQIPDLKELADGQFVKPKS